MGKIIEVYPRCYYKEYGKFEIYNHGTKTLIFTVKEEDYHFKVFTTEDQNPSYKIDVEP